MHTPTPTPTPTHINNNYDIQTLNNLNIFATIMETTLKDAPMTAVTGLWGTYTGGFPDSHLYSDISCKQIKLNYNWNMKT